MNKEAGPGSSGSTQKQYEVVVYWLDQFEYARRKTISRIKLPGTPELVVPAAEIEAEAARLAAGGRNIIVMIRNRDDHADILFEQTFDKLHDLHTLPEHLQRLPAATVV